MVKSLHIAHVVNSIEGLQLNVRQQLPTFILREKD